MMHCSIDSQQTNEFDKMFFFSDPPTVTIETTPLGYLVEKKDPVSLRCISDSNPPASVFWRREGLSGVFASSADLSYSPVTRKTAGIFSCEAENALGRSKPAFVEIDVKCK